MADQNESSPARVAFNLLQLCMDQESVGNFTERGKILDLYDECYYAASGQRGAKSRRSA